MVAPSPDAAFKHSRPEGGENVRASRAEDVVRVRRMLATDSASWSSRDIDLVAWRAMTTIGGVETFKWILPVFLRRSTDDLIYGWTVEAATLAHKLDYAAFDEWPDDQRRSALTLLKDWLEAQKARFEGYNPEDDAVLDRWIEGRGP